MTATKIIIKRSSILGKRPNNGNLVAGELAVNTNQNDPGLYFEVTDGNVVKVGPTAVLPTEPTSQPELGEQWFDVIDGTLRVGTLEDAKKTWRTVASPYLGGGGNVVFVAPEFPYSTDSVQNDGQALPYQTLSRAVLQLSKLAIQATLRGAVQDTNLSRRLENTTNRYTIYVAPSLLTANNEPGTTVDAFTTNFSTDPYAEVTVSQLTQFNTTTGGLVIPRGISIVGMDLKKCLVRPTYVPTFKNPSFPAAQAGVNQPRTSVFKWSGNCYLNNFSVADKLAYREVTSVTAEDGTGNAVFQSSRPHGLSYNEKVVVSFSDNVDQTRAQLNSTVSFTDGTYYVVPVTTTTFYLSTLPLPDSSVLYVQFSSLPVLPSDGTVLFTVVNELHSAHRLSVVSNASVRELAAYYEKVQKAFPDFFGGTVINGLRIVQDSEYVIVGPTESLYPDNLGSNVTQNTSAYANQLSVRSSYGMCGGDFDGEVVAGFRSVILNSCTVISLQNDPAAYEVYTTLTDPATGQSELKWWTLTTATYLSLPNATRPASVVDTPVATQLERLNRTALEDVRYYYETLKDENGLSFGLTDVDNDFRHFGFRAQNTAYVQSDAVYTVGPAVGVWALDGGTVSLVNSVSNFGSVAFKAEGFLGVNSLDGSYANSQGFVFEGVRTPLALNQAQVEDNANKTVLSLGSRILSVDEGTGSDEGIQLVRLSSDFSPCFILPHSLKPGSAVWVNAGNCTYRGFLATDGGPTVITGLSDPTVFATLRIRGSDSTIPTDPALISQLDIPYIRRFRDPRPDADRVYNLVVNNTFQNAVAPSVGSVLRLNQSSQSLGSSVLRPNVQLDPGSLGGWGRVFTVDAVATSKQGFSPNFNYVVGDNTQDTTYLLTVTATDLSRPWTNTYNTGQGEYTTYDSYNWYAAENNTWDAVYYNTNFSETVGPEKLAPVVPCSPFVPSNVLDRQDLVSGTFQGPFSPDPLVAEYPDGTYYRGATWPYTEVSAQDYYDDDDSSDSLGLLLKDVDSLDTTRTVEVIDSSSVVQTEQQADRALNRRYRPAVVGFNLLSASQVPNPKQTVCVVKLSHPSVAGVEYLRIVQLTGSYVEGIRLNAENSYFPNPPTSGQVWPAGTVVTVCMSNITPSAKIYDPDWSPTKRAVFRFFEVMGYSASVINSIPGFGPRYWGERVTPVTSLPIAPQNGYATVTAKWPLEFNQPSTIIANTHTWMYCGYINYSRGLPKYQTNDISRKLHTDFLCGTLWGGRLTVSGVDEKGETLSLGAEREAITGQYWDPQYPTVNFGNQQLYEQQEFVEFPSQVVVYSTDDFSSQFNGATLTFDLTRGGIPIPVEQLDPESILVQLGAVTQAPGTNYTISGYQITFANPPLEGTTCDVRVVTSEDQETTLTVVPLTLFPAFDGGASIFTMTSTEDITYLEINDKNTFVFLGGVEQIPLAQGGTSQAYAISRINDTTLQIVFNEAPLEDTTIDVRAICTGTYWANKMIFPVEVYSLDDISLLFDGALLEFPLTYLGQQVNPDLVNTQNLFVSVGGALQLPTSSYSVVGTNILFTEAPLAGTSSNLRVITNAEFLPCPLPLGAGTSQLKWGPGIVVNSENQIIDIDSGLVT